MFICNYCKKEYSSVSVLNYHQKTAVFCIKIQNDLKNNNKNVDDSEESKNNI